MSSYSPVLLFNPLRQAGQVLLPHFTKEKIESRETKRL